MKIAQIHSRRRTASMNIHSWNGRKIQKTGSEKTTHGLVRIWYIVYGTRLVSGRRLGKEPEQTTSGSDRWRRMRDSPRVSRAIREKL